MRLTSHSDGENLEGDAIRLGRDIGSVGRLRQPIPVDDGHHAAFVGNQTPSFDP